MVFMFTTDDIGFKGAGGPGGPEVGVVTSLEPRGGGPDWRGERMSSSSSFRSSSCPSPSGLG